MRTVCMGFTLNWSHDYPLHYFDRFSHDYPKLPSLHRFIQIIPLLPNISHESPFITGILVPRSIVNGCKWIIHYYHYEIIMIITQKSWLSRNSHDDSFTIPELSVTIPERVGIRGTQRVACQGQVRLGLCQALLLEAMEGGMENAGDRGDSL